MASAGSHWGLGLSAKALTDNPGPQLVDLTGRGPLMAGWAGAVLEGVFMTACNVGASALPVVTSGGCSEAALLRLSYGR